MSEESGRELEQRPAVWMAIPYLSHSRSEVSWIRWVYCRILEKRRKEESDSLLLHFDGQEDFVLRVVSDELIGERAWINQNTDKAHMHPLRVDEKTITGLLCEYC